MVGQVLGVDGDVQVRVVDPEGEIDQPLGGEAGRLAKDLAGAPAHGREVKQHLRAVDAEGAGPGVGRETEMPVALEGPVAACAERQEAQRLPFGVRDQPPAPAFQVLAPAEDEGAVRHAPAQVHALQRGAVQRPRVEDQDAGEAGLDQVAQVLLPQRRPVRADGVGVGRAHRRGIDPAARLDQGAADGVDAVRDGDGLHGTARSLSVLDSTMHAASCAVKDGIGRPTWKCG